LLSISVLFALFSSLAYRQGVVTIFGSVADASGGAMPGVTVTAINKETGASRKATTGPAGDYVISRLPTGTH
jgi:hypothetical protein